MQQDYPKIVSNRLRFCYNRMYCSDSGLHKQGGFSNFAIPKFNSSLMTNADTDIQELSNFLLDFATTLMGVGSHTSRVVRNVNRIAESFGYGVDMTIFQRNITMTVKHADDYSIRRTYVRRIPALALNFRTISDLSSLSWEAYDHDLPLDELKKRYAVITTHVALGSVDFGGFCQCCFLPFVRWRLDRYGISVDGYFDRFFCQAGIDGP